MSNEELRVWEFGNASECVFGMVDGGCQRFRDSAS